MHLPSTLLILNNSKRTVMHSTEIDRFLSDRPKIRALFDGIFHIKSPSIIIRIRYLIIFCWFLLNKRLGGKPARLSSCSLRRMAKQLIRKMLQFVSSRIRTRQSSSRLTSRIVSTDRISIQFYITLIIYTPPLIYIKT